MLTSGVVLLHDSVRPHAAAHNRALLEHFNWELFHRLPYSPVLAPSDYHLFTYLKGWLGSQHFSSNEELMEGVKMWLSSQVTQISLTGIWKLIPQYDKSLNSSSYSVEK
jgi:hypothetical protein